MDYRESVEYLESFINYEKTLSYEYPEAFKLDRMRMLAKELGNPQNAYECVIIAGSKGKGSTANFLSSILRMENYRVGLYTSPHLLEVRERIRVNGLMISEARFVELMHLIRQTLDTGSWRKNPPTYFEVLTVLAFCHFKQMKAQLAVLEVGLGGLYDSTNIAKARVVGLAPISLEHADKLGKTIAKIAVQKCGVIKGHEVVVSAPQTAEAEAVIQKTTHEREAQLFYVGKELKISEREYDEHSQKFDLKTPFEDYYGLETGLLGCHQIENAALAIGLSKALALKTRFEVSESAVKQGVLDASWPGRLEKIAESPQTVLDGAHNRDSLQKALAALRRHFHFSKLIVILAISSDKDVEGMLEVLAAEDAEVIITQFHGVRAFPAEELAERAGRHLKNSHLEEKMEDAWSRAKVLASADDLILATGSLYFISEIKKHELNQTV